MGRVKYSEFAEFIDVEAFMDAIGFEPEYQDSRGNHVGYCLWPENHTHGDTTGKFAIHPEKMVYNCYVCGGGSLLSLVMELNGWDSETAENYLRQFAGDTRTDTAFVDDFLSAFAKDAERRAEVMPFFNGRVLEKYEPAYEWGAANGLNEVGIRHYNVLYAPHAVKRSPHAGRYADTPDYVGPAVMWPHWWNKRLVGWQSRWLGCTSCWHDHAPGLNCDTCGCDELFMPRPEFVKKWTNTVDFPKENTLYGYQFAKVYKADVKNRPTMIEIPFNDKLYVVESAKTVLKLYQLGRLAVGTFGSNVNDAQLRLLRRFQSGIVLCKDNDKAGSEWFTQLYDYLVRYVPLEAIAEVPGVKGDLADLSDAEAEAWITDYTLDLTVPHM